MKKQKLFNKYIILRLLYFMLATVVFDPIASNAQNRTEIETITPLNIGDSIPKELWDIPLQVVNHPTGKETVRLKDYQGKLIILDFWGTYCSSCIAAFPKLKKIQEDNADKLKILAISTEKKDKLVNFFKSKNGSQYHYINSTFEDTIFRKYFPHRSVPHIVWITPEGKYLNPTNSYEVNQDHINAVLNKKEPKLRVKVDIDKSKPLFLSDNFFLIEDLKLPYYSIFVQGYYPGLPSGNNFRKNIEKKIYGRQITNRTLYSIVNMVANNIFEERGEKFNQKRLIIDTRSPLLSYRDHRILEGSIGYDQYFSLELIVPENKADSLYTYMLQDLNRNLDFSLRIEKKLVDCFTLVRTSNNDKIRTTGGNPMLIVSESQLDFTMKNTSMENLISNLNELIPTNLPVIDETGYTNKMDMEVSGLNSINDFRKSLKKYDLDLIKSQRELLMFVIKDK